MKRRLLFQSFPLEIVDSRELLQDPNSFLKNEEREIRLNERLIKEDVCEECGVFDLVMKFEGRFICGKCLSLTKARHIKS